VGERARPAFPVAQLNVQALQPSDFTKLSPGGGCQLACDRDLLTAAIDARQGAIRRACTKSSHVHNLVNASTALAIITVKNKPAERTVICVESDYTTCGFSAVIRETTSFAT